MANKAEILNQAIVNKVDSVLNNAKHLDSVYIIIEGNRGEVPTITYKIRELIVPDDIESEVKNDRQRVDCKYT